MLKICFVLWAVTLVFNVFASEKCAEKGSCTLPGSSGEKEGYVLSPVGAGSIKNVKQPPRLATLKGKRIAIVGGSFMASVTHPAETISEVPLAGFEKSFSRKSVSA